MIHSARAGLAQGDRVVADQQQDEVPRNQGPMLSAEARSQPAPPQPSQAVFP